MHPDIALFPNHAFYQDKLHVVPCPHQDKVLPLHGTGKDDITDLLLTRRIAFIAVDSPRQSPSDKVNTNEAQAIAATVRRIYELHHDTFSPTQTVGVIVPYRNQIAEVRKALEQYHIDVLHDITIDTVERYQGSQRDYIVYGFTIQKYYQLEFLTSNVFEEDGCIIDRKLNVAITRAREHLLMFGNPRLLSHNITFSELLSFVRERNGYFSVELSDYLSGNFKIK
jgi:superfamily I DNA and/or RNA helicase